MKTTLLSSAMAILLVCIAQFGLAGFGRPSVGSSRNALPVDDKGFIAGTITFPKNRQFFDKYVFRLKSDDGGSTEFKIHSYENVNSPTPTNSYSKTYVFILEQKAGKYRIDRVRAKAVDREEGTESHWGRAKDFLIPVEVRPGEITYMGEIFFSEKIDDSLLGLRIVDNFERDIKYFKRKNPKLDWEKATKSILQPR